MIYLECSVKLADRKGTMKLKKLRKGLYEYKYYSIAYIPERKLWNIATYGFAGWNFMDEFKTLRECRKWLMENLEEN